MKKYYYLGIVLFLFWLTYCIYGYVTFIEMEIFLVIYMWVVGIIFFPFYFLCVYFWNKSQKVVNVLWGLFLIVVISIVTLFLVQ